MAMQLWLPAFALVFWLKSVSAVCSPNVYFSNSQCEEALANDAQSYPPCSTLDFSVSLLICELRSRTDLDALTSGRRALPGLPPTNGNFDCLLTDCSTFVVCAPISPYTVYICFEKTTTPLVLQQQTSETYGDIWFYKHTYRVSSSVCAFVAKSILPCANLFVEDHRGDQYVWYHICSRVGRRDPPVTPLACRQYACKQAVDANVVLTVPAEGWCQFVRCPNSHSIPYQTDPAGHTWVIYAKHN